MNLNIAAKTLAGPKPGAATKPISSVGSPRKSRPTVSSYAAVAAGMAPNAKNSFAALDAVGDDESVATASVHKEEPAESCSSHDE